MGRNLIFKDQVANKPDTGHWILNRSTGLWEEEKINIEDLKRDIFVCGFPRSGNNFLISAIHLSYNVDRQDCIHTVSALKEKSYAFVPFRSPEKCIPSWMHKRQANVNQVIDHYVRFNEYVLKNTKKCILLDFEIFINDLSYLYEKIFIKTKLLPIKELTSLDVIDWVSSLKLHTINLSNNDHYPEQTKKYLESKEKIKVENIYKNLINEHLNQAKG